MKNQYKNNGTILRGLWGLALSFIFLLAGSCDSFTEVDMPQSELTGVTVFEDVATAKAALANVYALMRENGVASGSLVSATPLMANYSDDMDSYGSNMVTEQFTKHMIHPNNSTLLRLWAVPYSEIYAINAIIEGVSVSTAISGEDRDKLLGEAFFLRAFNYFYMVNIFGDIPYTTTTNYEANAVIAKTPQDQVWQNIISDLIMAESLLPEEYPSPERVRINKATVKAMLARVYLYTQNYALAETYATTVINNPAYSIEPNPALVFLAGSPSTIWAFHPGVAGQNTKDASTYNFSSGPPSKPALSEALYNSFEPGDARKSEWIKIITNGSSNWYRPFKYKKASSTESSEEYTIVLRLEEQYLIRAESRLRNGDVNGAQQDINVIRNRAGLSNTLAATQGELQTAILQERRHEFFTEQSHRWFDLKRTGNAAAALSAIKPGWKATDVLLPIPEAELLLNENLLPQNPGY